MSNVGTTTGKEPDHIEDGDLKSADELRGMMKDVHKAKLSLNEKATVQGLMTQLDVFRQRSEQQAEQMNRLIGMYGTLRAEFDQFKQQRIKELNLKMNHGSTTQED